jgi:hypothetical protein
MEPLHARLKAVIERHTQAHRRFKELEEKTSISAATWKTYWTRGSRPSAELIEAVGKAWPEYAFWIGTGVTDEKHGHVSAVAEETFPETGRSAQSACTAYFKACIQAKAEAIALIESPKKNEDSKRPPILNLNSVPRILAKKLHGAARLDEAMDAVRLESQKRKIEIGLRPELEAIVNLIQFNYDEQVLLKLITEYNEQRRRELV